MTREEVAVKFLEFLDQKVCLDCPTTYDGQLMGYAWNFAQEMGLPKEKADKFARRCVYPMDVIEFIAKNLP